MRGFLPGVSGTVTSLASVRSDPGVACCLEGPSLGSCFAVSALTFFMVFEQGSHWVPHWVL